jgi:acetyl-CoA C-acetyltransferase
MTDVVIVSAARTPVGSFNGAFAAVPAHELGKTAIQAALARADVAPKDVSEVILGQILTAAQGQNPARQASVNAGIPVRDAGLDRQPAVRLGLARGGARLSGDPQRRRQHRRRRRPGIDEPGAACRLSARGQKMGALEFTDTMLKDGLWDAFHGYHMGVTAENVAREWQITREMQDRFAVASQNKAEAARKAGASRTRSRPSP